jgi:hypothetical protein
MMSSFADVDEYFYREQTINTKKNIAFQYGERQFLPSMDDVPIASDDTFEGYCSQKVGFRSLTFYLF